MDARPDTKDVLINLLAFQAAWLSLVLGAATGYALAGLAVALAAMLLHLARSPDWSSELKLMTFALALGVFVESALMAGGLVAFRHNGPISAPVATLAPIWLLALWPAFATLLNVAFRGIRQWTVAAVIFGGVFVPVAYYAGAKLGVMILSEPYFRSLFVIGLAWALALPLMFTMARRWDGWRNT
ncbi:MAG: hypothetical protein APF80_06870 [Alphaproteobacteria bacterium BRH_c36]|nr:MAG: hypothetical protein APF80_06870 [Alphaproteobacteria bacterium BRH_c36]